MSRGDIRILHRSQRIVDPLYSRASDPVFPRNGTPSHPAFVLFSIASPKEPKDTGWFSMEAEPKAGIRTGNALVWILPSGGRV